VTPALLFDMDGVIVDSNPIHRQAWAIYNRRNGLETDEDMERRMYGKRNDQIVRDLFGADLSDEEVFQRGADKERLYRQMIAPLLSDALVPGIREFLQLHQDRPTGLATNAEPANVEFVLQRSGLAHLFRAVVDGHQVRNPKPDPEIYLRLAEMLEISPARCVVFEDSASGIAAARAAGMTVVGVRTTHTELPGVSLAIDDFRSADLESWLGAI
jgi:beta-phosphoglucomutase